MSWSWLADLIVLVHAAYVGFVVLGQVTILVGAWLRWGWVRNRWFRLLHLAAIGFVAAEAIVGLACPLTVWEDAFRRAAGQTVEEGTFIGRWMHYLIFYEAPEWVFTLLYLGFALLVLLTLFLIPPRWRSNPARTAK
jgi:hypothetical protein